MVSKLLGERVDVPGLGRESLLQRRFLTPPYGYVIGVVLWPVFVSLISLWGVLLLSGLPSIVATVGGLVVVFGGAVVTAASSASVMALTAWHTPDERLRRQFTLLFPSFLLAVPLFGLYREFLTFPYRYELGMSLFAAHELSKIVFLGPAVGFAFVFFPMVVFGLRHLSK